MNFTKTQQKKSYSQFNKQNSASSRSFPKRNTTESQLDANLFVKKALLKEEIQYIPSRLIEDLPVDKAIIANLLKKGYETPTEIQDKTLESVVGKRCTRPVDGKPQPAFGEPGQDGKIEHFPKRPEPVHQGAGVHLAIDREIQGDPLADSDQRLPGGDPREACSEGITFRL